MSPTADGDTCDIFPGHDNSCCHERKRGELHTSGAWHGRPTERERGQSAHLNRGPRLRESQQLAIAGGELTQPRARLTVQPFAYTTPALIGFRQISADFLPCQSSESEAASHPKRPRTTRFSEGEISAWSLAGGSEKAQTVDMSVKRGFALQIAVRTESSPFSGIRFQSRTRAQSVVSAKKRT